MPKAANDKRQQAHLLVVDDDADLCQLISGFLGRKGYRVTTAGRRSAALEALERHTFDLVLCDHRLPDADSLEMMDHFRNQAPGVPVIVITGYSDVRVAVDLMRRGALDYVVKPLYPDELAMRIEEALEEKQERQAEAEKPAAKARSPRTGKAPAGTGDRAFVHGTGAFAKQLAQHIDLVAPTDLGVLITGATGTGKEYVAREIHRNSARAEAPFVAVDCGALPDDLAGSELFGHVKGAFTGALQDREGCFQRAHGGTLFLDEVGNLSPENQMRLLRALQERVVQRLGSGTTEAVDVRQIAATNEELHRSDRGGFREDLFHRLNEFSIHLPPLRQRPEDILHYAEHFLGLARERLGRQVDGIDTEAAALLKRQPWPGNLRELNNVIKRAVLVCTGDRITVRDLPAELALAPANNGTSKAPDGDLKEVARQAERETIMDALRQNAYNKTRTAAMLNIDRKTLYNKLKAFGIEG
ncbi:MAG TPA: sigma-54 dependent transcriptional regulator [Flavobacteriales bacterium]|nr:sigma-54 dependent transcriptional regulator [Flavobacteriales bacterium]